MLLCSNELFVVQKERQENISERTPRLLGRICEKLGQLLLFLEQRFLLCWPVDRVIRHTVDADKHPVVAPTVLIAATDDPVTSSTTNSGGTRHLNGTPLVPMPLVT